MNDVWEVINRMNENIINIVYSSCLIAMGKHLHSDRKHQLSRQVPYGNSNVNNQRIKSNISFYSARQHYKMVISEGSCNMCSL